MTSPIDLKEIERKAFRSTYQDGLWDMYYGLIIISMAIFVYRPASGYSPMNIIMAVLMFSASYALFTAGKKLITLPRMGMVTFGAIRKKKRSTLAIVMGIFIIIQVLIIGVTTLGWFNLGAGEKLNSLLPEGKSSLIWVALIGSLFVGPSMIVIAYLSDFLRGYYIAILMALAVFMMIYMNQPIYPVIIGVVVFLPGLVLLVRFLNKYQLKRREASDE